MAVTGRSWNRRSGCEDRLSDSLKAHLEQDYGGLRQKSWKALVPALGITSEGDFFRIRPRKGP